MFTIKWQYGKKVVVFCKGLLVIQSVLTIFLVILHGSKAAWKRGVNELQISLQYRNAVLGVLPILTTNYQYFVLALSFPHCEEEDVRTAPKLPENPHRSTVLHLVHILFPAQQQHHNWGVFMFYPTTNTDNSYSGSNTESLDIAKTSSEQISVWLHNSIPSPRQNQFIHLGQCTPVVS